MALCMRDTLEEMGLAVSWQEVEDGRPNVVGRLEGAGGGRSLMFNGHMDTSYSGREPHLRAKRASSRARSCATATSGASGSRT